MCAGVCIRERKREFTSEFIACTCTVWVCTQISTLRPSLPSHLELPLHQVHSSDHLSDGVLHLQPSVHLHEVVALAVVHDELDSAC